jgi:hypothetical protein
MPRLAICNRRDAAHSSVLTTRLGRRASAGPCQLLARVRPRRRSAAFQIRLLQYSANMASLAAIIYPFVLMYLTASASQRKQSG